MIRLICLIEMKILKNIKEEKRVNDHVIKIKGYLCPLTVEGNPELLVDVACKNRRKNALGFGMVETQ